MKLARLIAPALALLLAGQAHATAIRLEPVVSSVAPSTPFEVRIVADIDAADAIIGFGFDLDAPGVTLLGFATGPGFADDSTYLAPFSDSDGIRGASGGDLLLGPPVSGVDILLGTLTLSAANLGPLSISLSADDLSFNYTEGLIPLSLSLVNFMPAVTPGTVTVSNGGTVPTPGTAACTAVALLAALAPRRRRAAAPAGGPCLS